MTTATDKSQTDVNGDGNNPGETRTFTQQDLDTLVAARLKREREKYSDYDELKEAAGKYRQLEEDKKTEEQKLRDQLTAAETEKAQVMANANKKLIQAAFISEATAAGVKHPKDAYALAVNDGHQFEIAGEEITGVKEAVTALIQAGRLVLNQQRAAALDGGAGGGERQSDKGATLTDEEKVIAQKMGLTEAQYAAQKPNTRR